VADELVAAFPGEAARQWAGLVSAKSAAAQPTVAVRPVLAQHSVPRFLAREQQEASLPRVLV